MHEYEIIIYWSNEDQTFIAEVPELSGCLAHGHTPSEALADSQEAINLSMAGYGKRVWTRNPGTKS